MKGNKPISENPRIVVNDAEAKQKLAAIADRKNESMKAVLVELIEREYKKND